MSQGIWTVLLIFACFATADAYVVGKRSFGKVILRPSDFHFKRTVSFGPEEFGNTLRALMSRNSQKKSINERFLPFF